MRPFNMTGQFKNIGIFKWPSFRVPSVGETIYAYNESGKYIGRWAVEHVDVIICRNPGLEMESYEVHVLPVDDDARRVSEALEHEEAEAEKASRPVTPQEKK